MHEDYRLVLEPPSVIDYVRLRRQAGLSPKSETQAAAAITGAWHAVHAVAESTMEVVGMGRVIGDGGWYFHIIDMAVLPNHQRRGIGDAILTELLRRIREKTPPDAFVTLLADPPGRRLYQRHGFVERPLRRLACVWPGERRPPARDHDAAARSGRRGPRPGSGRRRPRCDVSHRGRSPRLSRRHPA